MIAAKWPQSVKAIKVKGHATTEVVEEGKVKAEDKKGNDNVDLAAGWGSHQEQRRLHCLTEMCAARHEAHRKLMGKVQRFLVHMNKQRRGQGIKST